MATNSQLPEGRDGAHSTLDMGIETLNSAKETSTITPAKTAFGSAGVLLEAIKVLSFYSARQRTSGSSLTRSPWSISRNTPGSGSTARRSVGYLIGRRREKEQRTSVSRRTGR